MQHSKVSSGVLATAIAITAFCSGIVIAASGTVRVVTGYLGFYEHSAVVYQGLVDVALFALLTLLYGIIHSLLARIFAWIEDALLHWLNAVFPEIDFHNWNTSHAMIFGALWPITGTIIVPLTFIACVFASLFKMTFPD